MRKYLAIILIAPFLWLIGSAPAHADTQGDVVGASTDFPRSECAVTADNPYPCGPGGGTDASSCTLKFSYDERYTWIQGVNRDLKIYTEIQYFHCRNTTTGNRWVEPHLIRTGYAASKHDTGAASTLNCSVLGWFQEVRFDVYFSDRAGHAIAPGTSTMPCYSTGNYETVILLNRSQNPRLIHCGGSPKWADDYIIAVRGQVDYQRSLAGTMWGYTGLFPVHPNCP